MPALDQIVNINISQQTSTVPTASFAVPLIVGPTPTGWSDSVHGYSSPAGMLTDGFTVNSPEYKYALELFQQAMTPTQFYVGKRTGGSVASDMTAIAAQNNSWYGVVLCSNVDQDILDMAAAIEPLKKIFLAATATSAVATSATNDIASVMKGLSYKRTALLYSPTSKDKGIDAAWIGGQLPATPGSNNWAFKTLVGISPDTLTDAQQLILIGNPQAGTAGKNVNIYQTAGGVNITQMGTMIGGQYIDITIGLDWLQSTIQTNIFTALVQAAKIPYTDKGTSVLLSAVKAAIDQGVINGLIDGASAITITAPLVATVPTSQRANRIAPTITFACRLQGAFNAVIVNGTVTV